MPRRTRLKAVLSDEAKRTRGRVWLRELDSRFLVCHAQGHMYPRMHDLTGSNKGIRATGLGKGAWQLTFVCPMCDGERTMTTSPKGVLELPVIYKYRNLPGYKAPPGAGLTKREYMQELWRRFYHENFEELDHLKRQAARA